MASLMKGHTFAKGKHRLAYPAMAEYKYDEIRLDVRQTSAGLIEFQSYADKPLHNLRDFERQFEEAFQYLPGSRLDMGFIVNRGGPSAFNDTYRYLRSSKGVPKDLLVTTREFVLFDQPDNASNFGRRMEDLDWLAEELRDKYGLPVIRPKRVPVYSEDEVFAAYQAAIDSGHEGLMVKDLGHHYELGKRVYGWLKVKPEEDEDGIIVAVNRGTSITGEPLDRAGSVTIRMPDGSVADCGGIKHELGRQMLEAPHLFIGEWATFTYMMRDRQGGYRHPRFQRLREAKA